MRRWRAAVGIAVVTTACVAGGLHLLGASPLHAATRVAEAEPQPADEAPTGRVDPAEAARMHERLAALLSQARPAWGTGEVTTEPGAPAPERPSMPVISVDDAGHGRVDPRYLRRRAREGLTPLALDCYRAALGRDPSLSGRLVLRFHIAGDRHVGGVVDEVTLARGTTIDDPELTACVTGSMMSVTFDAPPEGDEVTGVYGFELSPQDVTAEG